jgi:hypothetical protein
MEKIKGAPRMEKIEGAPRMEKIEGAPRSSMLKPNLPRMTASGNSQPQEAGIALGDFNNQAENL